VGIDGFASATVEQTGTIAECSGGVLLGYAAWYEFYPAQTIQIIPTILVNPGDSISASVSYSSATHKFTVSITDSTTGGSFTLSQSSPGAARSSAEWIVEAPSTTSGIVQLPKFSTVSFTLSKASAATHSGNLGSFGAAVDKITMVSQLNPSKTKALPSALGSGGSSFTVVWKSTGP